MQYPFSLTLKKNERSSIRINLGSSVTDVIEQLNNSTSVTLLSYKTPANISDTLTFSNVVDTSDIENTGNVTLNVSDLKTGPSLIGLIGSLNTISQSFPSKPRH